MIISKPTNLSAPNNRGDRRLIIKYAILTAAIFLPLIWSILFDLWLFSLTPIPAVLLGAAIVIAANVYIAHREHKIAKAAIQLPHQ